MYGTKPCVHAKNTQKAIRRLKTLAVLCLSEAKKKKPHLMIFYAQEVQTCAVCPSHYSTAQRHTPRQSSIVRCTTWCEKMFSASFNSCMIQSFLMHGFLFSSSPFCSEEADLFKEQGLNTLWMYSQPLLKFIRCCNALWVTHDSADGGGICVCVWRVCVCVSIWVLFSFFFHLSRDSLRLYSLFKRAE